MPRYTFLIGRDGKEPSMVDGQVETLRDDDDAIAYARALAEVGGRQVKIGVAVGCGTGSDIDWLGAWDQEPGRPAVWSRDG